MAWTAAQVIGGFFGAYTLLFAALFVVVGAAVAWNNYQWYRYVEWLYGEVEAGRISAEALCGRRLCDVRRGGSP